MALIQENRKGTKSKSSLAYVRFSSSSTSYPGGAVSDVRELIVHDLDEEVCRLEGALRVELLVSAAVVEQIRLELPPPGERSRSYRVAVVVRLIVARVSQNNVPKGERVLTRQSAAPGFQ